MDFDPSYWKTNCSEACKHYEQWWRQDGPVLTLSGLPQLAEPRDNIPAPDRPEDPLARHTDPVWFALNQQYALSRRPFPADNLPIAFTDYGCVQLAACFGAEPGFDDHTVWYAECISEPDACPPLSLTKTERWWQVYRRIMLKVREVGQGKFIVGMPAFGSNLDVLAELRGTQNLLYDLLDRPDWVRQKLEEINQSFFDAFDDYYQHIQLPDGSSAYSYFHIWGPGKVSQVQCDFAAMISPDMFGEFVVPPLQRQCEWLDCSLFHLDGPRCICHLDHLLAIPELDAVQWTPGAGMPGAGDDQWYPLYTKVLNANKSVQILGVGTEEAKRILKIFGGKGVYLSVHVDSETEANEMIALIEAMR